MLKKCFHVSFKVPRRIGSLPQDNYPWGKRGRIFVARKPDAEGTLSRFGAIQQKHIHRRRQEARQFSQRPRCPFPPCRFAAHGRCQDYPLGRVLPLPEAYFNFASGLAQDRHFKSMPPQPLERVAQHAPPQFHVPAKHAQHWQSSYHPSLSRILRVSRILHPAGAWLPSLAPFANTRAFQQRG